MVIKKIKSIFELDLRSLAFFRIVLGLVILGDLLIRLADYNIFYTDSGIHARTFMIDDSNQFRISLYHMVGRSEQVLALMLLHLGIGVAFLLGIKTRLIIILLWFFTISLQNRNYTLLNNGDSLIRCLLFFGIFLPLGARYSFDSFKQKILKENKFYSIGNIGLIGQLALMYIFTGVLKTGPQWRVDYTAVDMALMLDQFTTGLGAWMGQFHTFNKFLTWSTIVVELYIPFLLLSPWWRDHIRASLIFIFTMFHLSISAMMHIGVFSAVSIAGWMPLIPSFVWDKYEKTKLYKNITNFFDRKQFNYHLPPLKNIAWIGFPFFIFALYWNLTTISEWNFTLPKLIHQTGQVTRLDQSWGMFAPFPVRDDGWNVIHGKLQNGKDIDLIRGTEGTVSYDKPQNFREIYPNQRWHKFLTNLRYNDYSSSLLQYGKWLCRSNNSKRERGQKLSTFEILYMEEYTLDIDQVKPIKKRTLWNHDCFK